MLEGTKQLNQFPATLSVSGADLIYSASTVTGIEQRTTVSQLQTYMLSGIAQSNLTNVTPLGSDTIPIGRSGLFQTTVTALANFALQEIAEGSLTTATALTGAEFIPISQNSQLVQTTAANIAALALSALAPVRQSIPVLTAGQSVYVSQGYSPGLLNVFVAGFRLNPSQYMALDGIHITISDTMVLGIIVPGMTVDVDAVVSLAVAGVATPASVQALDPANQPAIGSFTGSEIISTRQGAGLYQSTISKIAQWIVGTVYLADYNALRAYTGFNTTVHVTGYLGTASPEGIAGVFVANPTDTTSTDNGGTIIVANNGVRWYRQFVGPASANWFYPLVTGSGATENWTAALQALFNAATCVELPYRTLGYQCQAVVNVNSGQRIKGNGAYVFCYNNVTNLFSIVNQSDIVIEGILFSQNYVPTGSPSVNSAIYSTGSSNVKVTNCEFQATGLYSISTNLSGNNWIVTENRFFNLGGTAFDARGGAGHLVANNLIVNSGDDAIDVANAPGAGTAQTVITGNVILNPGQYNVGGSGIRTNAAGAVISNNQIYNANESFIVVAALSTNGVPTPDRVVITGNVGYGIKPTTNNTTGCVMVKNSAATEIYNNDFDAVGNALMTITNVISNNGTGYCQYVSAGHGYTTGNIVTVTGVVGVPNANGTGAVTVIDANNFYINFTFSGTYTSGGTAYNAINGIRAYSGNNTPSQNSLVIARNNKFTRIYNVIYVQLLGVNEFIFTDNYVNSYYSTTLFTDTSVISEFTFSRNRMINGTYALFYGGSTTVSITSLIMNDNDCSPLSFTNNVPFNFNGMTITRAEALRNKLGGAGDFTAPTNVLQFYYAQNVAEFFFDGDHSGVRYGNGSGTIAAGQTLSSAISHGCALITGQAQQPKSFELQTTVSLGATTAAFVQPTAIYSTTFVAAALTAAPSGGLAFLWRLTPVVQRYINGTLS